MNNKPTIHDLRKAGYKIKVTHSRRVRFATLTRGKLIISVELMSLYDFNHNLILAKELLAKGGVTHMTIFDPETEAEFVAHATCRNDEAYCKLTGINKCLDRLVALMLVCDGKDGFKYRLQVKVEDIEWKDEHYGPVMTSV